MDDQTSDAVPGSKLNSAMQSAKARLDAASGHAIDAATAATTSIADLGANAATQVKAGLQKLDTNRELVADHLDTAAKASYVAWGVAAAGAAIAAPTGIAALGVSIGVVSAPIVVLAAPVLAGVAIGAGTVSASAALYNKYRRKQSKSSEA